MNKLAQAASPTHLDVEQAAALLGLWGTESPFERVRAEAAGALAAMGEAGGPAREALARVAGGDRHAFVRAAARDALRAVAPSEGKDDR